jgi:RNA polymerase sigma-70 factor (ECF subfamily)
MQLELKSDQELVSLYMNGYEPALAILIKRHKRKVYSYIFLLVKNREVANDLFQDVFVKIIKTLKTGKYNEEGKFLPWVMRISHNLVIDYFRNVKRQHICDHQRENNEYSLFDIIKCTNDNIEISIIKGQITDDVRKLIDKLPSEQKEIVFMRHYSDMSFKEIAEQTNVSINTALGRMRYALINLRKMIDKHEITLNT